MNHMKRLRLSLGISNLIPEWKFLFSSKGLREDILAGVTVSCVSIPLSLAIALASGVEPGVGLITAIVASVVCALFGGTQLGVCGPAIAMAVLISSVVQDYGLSGLWFVGIGCGILQLLTGYFGLGQIVRFVPVPVVAGFTAGIGAIIFIGQLPRALGLSAPDQAHVVGVILHLRDLIHETQMLSLGLTMATIAIVFITPRLFPRLPASLIAIIFVSMIVHGAGISVETIGSMPNAFPMPRVAAVPKQDVISLLATTIVVFLLASLETLLSYSAIDKLFKNNANDPNQELIGQGLSNIAVSVFGGIPVTSVIARSALNIQAGAKTRRASIIHAIILVLTIYFLAPMMSKIPVVVLAGVLLSVTLRMIHPREFLGLWNTSRLEGAIYLITFLIIVFVDLVAGIQVGILAALLIAAIRLDQTRTHIQFLDVKGPMQVSINGPLSFLSSDKIETIRAELTQLDTTRGVVIDMSGVSSLDASGSNQLFEIFDQIVKQNRNFVLKGLDPVIRRMLLMSDQNGNLVKHIASHESDVQKILGNEYIGASVDRLIYGVEKFRQGLLTRYDTLFKNLATGQSPHTLFITCSDSRINPNLITSTDPGELFIIRNVGNIIPPFGEDGSPAEGAAVEYSLGVLGVKEIVVCGHSGCGAMKAVLSEDIFSESSRAQLPSVAQWLEEIRPMKKQLRPGASPEEAAEFNALLQVENLKTYPIVQERLLKGDLRIRAWYYDIGASDLEEWDEVKKLFVSVGLGASRSLEKRIEAGIQFQMPFEATQKHDK